MNLWTRDQIYAVPYRSSPHGEWGKKWLTASKVWPQLEASPAPKATWSRPGVCCATQNSHWAECSPPWCHLLPPCKTVQEGDVGPLCQHYVTPEIPLPAVLPALCSWSTVKGVLQRGTESRTRFITVKSSSSPHKMMDKVSCFLNLTEKLKMAVVKGTMASV